jgi:hypothetical protein
MEHYSFRPRGGAVALIAKYDAQKHTRTDGVLLFVVEQPMYEMLFRMKTSL